MVISHREAFNVALEAFDVNAIDIIRSCEKLANWGLIDRVPTAAQLSRWRTGKTENIETDTLRAFELALPPEAQLYYYFVLANGSRVNIAHVELSRQLAEIQQRLLPVPR